MKKIQYVEFISAATKKHDLPPDIVYGVCMQESAMNAHACRYEHNYKYLITKPNKPFTCSYDTEMILQKCSIGLMQVMGAVYREYGYEGWLSALFCEPATQLDFGCLHLKNKLIKHQSIEKALSAYNAGVPIKGNADYVQKVLKFAKVW